MREVSLDQQASMEVGGRLAAAGLRALRLIAKIVVPLLSILGLWYLAIYTSNLPEFVIPQPSRVLEALVNDWDEISFHLWETLKVALLGFLLANVVGIGLAVVLTASPLWRHVVMPAAITIRNVPYVALVTILMLAFGDTIGSKVAIVVIAGFFPVMVNTYHGLLSTDEVVLDRMRVLNASPFETFFKVKIPYALPHIVAAQEITGTNSIIVAIAAEWMISSTGLGYVINKAMQLYRGDLVYAVALLAALLSFVVYSVVSHVGSKLDWRSRADGRHG
ncbi:ABC transporter permease [Aminobacter sp. Y103A]|uniref:ABC transporter permease n=1 Tax=Aminobacter sp. Y103A TaxID=1870862 RepID=UPI0025736E78|nr:ABC transporter permease [Aminobacter sp. SS-2016]BBD39630.1 ABC transporter permease [Aminobacter sp. SS-2016]